MLRGATTGLLALPPTPSLRCGEIGVLGPVTMVDRYTRHQYRPQLLWGLYGVVVYLGQAS